MTHPRLAPGRPTRNQRPLERAPEELGDRDSQRARLCLHPAIHLGIERNLGSHHDNNLTSTVIIGNRGDDYALFAFPRSFSTRFAALWPAQPTTLPAGWVP